MPIYTFQCNACQQADDRFLKLAAVRTRARAAEMPVRREMRRVVNVPTCWPASTAGPTASCATRIEQRRLRGRVLPPPRREKLGGKLGGGMFVPGLCRQGKAFDPYAVCHSRQEVIDKARKLGVGVRGPGINVEPRLSEKDIREREEEDGVPSAEAVKHSVATEIMQNHGGKVTRKKYREIVEATRDKGRRRTPKASPTIDSIFGDASIYQ